MKNLIGYIAIVGFGIIVYNEYKKSQNKKKAKLNVE
jgi:hypothetical protein